VTPPAKHDVSDLPPSCKCVLLAFRARDADRLTRQELLDETGLAESTLDDALRTLENRHWLLLARKSDRLNRVTAEIQHSPEI
jgi:hypothetical protein